MVPKISCELLRIPTVAACGRLLPRSVMPAFADVGLSEMSVRNYKDEVREICYKLSMHRNFRNALSNESETVMPTSAISSTAPTELAKIKTQVEQMRMEWKEEQAKAFSAPSNIALSMLQEAHSQNMNYRTLWGHPALLAPVVPVPMPRITVGMALMSFVASNVSVGLKSIPLAALQELHLALYSCYSSFGVLCAEVQGRLTVLPLAVPCHLTGGRSPVRFSFLASPLLRSSRRWSCRFKRRRPSPSGVCLSTFPTSSPTQRACSECPSSRRPSE